MSNFYKDMITTDMTIYQFEIRKILANKDLGDREKNELIDQQIFQAQLDKLNELSIYKVYQLPEKAKHTPMDLTKAGIPVVDWRDIQKEINKLKEVLEGGE